MDSDAKGKHQAPGAPKGRGAASNPTSRFERLRYASRAILNNNDSPDIELKRGLNLYKGYSHGWPC